MNSLNKRTKTFPQGGVHPPDCKLTELKPIEKLPLPASVAIHVGQHIGKPATIIVKTGDKVKTGQLIAKGEGFISTNHHASISGTVQKIEDVMDQTGNKKKAIIIKREGDLDEWIEGVDLTTELKKDITLSPEEIKSKVYEAGIIGLGGAGFPSHVKLSVPEGKCIEFLLINGVECEPFLTSDHRLMLEKSEQLIVGIHIILKSLGINRAIIGIEDNKPDAILKLRDITKDIPEIEIIALKVQYPQGGERQLVKALVNREIPPAPRGLPIDAGCAVFNVATVYAIYEAVQKNKPLIERVVTITGHSLKNPSNFLVRIGSSILNLIEAAGGLPEDTGKILSGGPMMGKALAKTDIPLTKTMGGLILFPNSQANRKEVIECIRCGKCVSACPLGLEPYLVMALCKKGGFDRAEQERVLNCCECACCCYVCPSNRPLLDYIRLGKTIVSKIMRERDTK